MAGFKDRLRGWFGRYAIDDPRPIAEGAPYTFFLPSENELLAIEAGDLVKLIFLPVPEGKDWSAERMWVEVTGIDGDQLTGNLANTPLDMPQLSAGDRIRFHRWQIIDLRWGDDRSTTPPPAPEPREYWDRCMVDDCVMNGRSLVHYLYREAPDLGRPEDRFPDSGWRIRGSDEAIAADEAAGLAPKYIALGAVLNRDDSWLHLIDAAEGSAYRRDPASQKFEASP